MIAGGGATSAGGRVRIRPVALPVEHGGWAILFEPIVLGLLLAPSLAGLSVSLGALCAFLARHPFKLVAGDWRHGRRSARTAMAEGFFVLYVCIAAIFFLAALKIADQNFLLPLLIAAPIVLVQLLYDSVGHSRTLMAELAGSISMGAVATAIAIGGGWPRPTAFGLWAILAARTVPTVLYIRARLRLLRSKPASTRIVIIMHVTAILMVFGLARAGVVPLFAIVALVILFLRAVLGFSKTGKLVTPKELGLRELSFGAMTVFAVVLGHTV